MSSITESHGSLPYIDADIMQQDRDAANRLIQRELPHNYNKQLHPSIQSLPAPRLSDLIQQEVARVGAGQPRRGGIDISRYEAPDEPSGNADIDEWRTALKNAYTASTYLSGRRSNLALLDEYGKNAWLIGNYDLEGTLKTLETDLAQIKSETEEVNKARKIAQENSQGELLALEDSWKTGIGRIIEVQVATEKLRAELNILRRNADG